MDTVHRFLADAMLGKLARWLRILGWDTNYVVGGDGAKLLRIAENEGRVLLTRRQDIENPRLVFVASERLEEQLLQLDTLFGIVENAKPFTRCIDCNAELQAVDKSKVKGKVPFYTYETQQEFFTCPSCGKIFWPGSHYDAMLKKIKRLKESE